MLVAGDCLSGRALITGWMIVMMKGRLVGWEEADEEFKYPSLDQFNLSCWCEVSGFLVFAAPLFVLNEAYEGYEGKSENVTTNTRLQPHPTTTYPSCYPRHDTKSRLPMTSRSRSNTFSFRSSFIDSISISPSYSNRV